MVYRQIKRYFTFLAQGPKFYGGGGKSKAPAAPDPYVTAAAQFQQNKKSG